jgi:O-antigen/teichoic acid export membrane protein
MKDIFTSYVGYIVLTVANLLLGVLTARLLLPVGRGELGQVILWPSLIATLGAFSISDAMVYFIGQRRAEPHHVLGSAFGTAALISLILCGVGFAITPHIFAEMPPEVRLAAYIFVLYIPLSYIGTYIVTMFLGRMRFAQWNLLRALLSISNLLYALAIWWLFGASVLGFTASVLLANLTVTAIGAVMLARAGLFGLRPRFALMSSMLGFGAALHLGDMLSMANQRIDQILITQWLPAHEYGYYLVAMAVWSASSGLVVVLGQLAFPKVAAEMGMDAKMLALGRYMRLAVAVALLGSLALLLLAPWLIALVFGAAFSPAAPVLQILSLGVAPYACRSLLGQAFKALGRPKAIIFAESVALAANAIGLTFLIPRLGIEGAAIIFVAGQTIGCVILAAALRYRLGIGLRPLFMATPADVRFVMARLREMRQPSAP